MSVTYHLDPTPTITNAEGKPILTDQEVDETGRIKPNTGRNLTVGLAVVTALGFSDPNDKEPIDKKVEKFKLSLKVHGAHLPIELTSDEATLVKNCVNKVWTTPAVVYHVCEAIVTRPEKPKKAA